MKTRPQPLAVMLAFVLLALAASGCGGSSGDAEGVARLDSTTASTGTGADADTGGNEQASDDTDPQEAALDWARCMRGEGVNVPDPEVDGSGRLTVRPGMGAGRIDDNPKKFNEAMKKCGSPLGQAGPLNLTEEQRQQLQESALKFARCMREHGIDVPDPDFSQGRGSVMRIGPGAEFDPDDPKFQEAQKACEPIMREARQDAGIARSAP